MDPQATAQLLSLIGIDKALKTNLQEARNYLTQTCTTMVQTAAHIQDQGNFSFLPLYVMGILKSGALMARNDIRYDIRVATWARLTTLSCERTSLYFYPRLVPVHDITTLSGELGTVGQDGLAVIPEKLRCAGASLTQRGAYIIDNGAEMVLWLGADVDPGFLKEVLSHET